MTRPVALPWTWTGRLALAIGFALALATASNAQTEASRPPDLSGTWKLDREASEIDPSVHYTRLAGNAGTPSMLYITHAKNGTIIVGSNANTSHARTYRASEEPSSSERTGSYSETVPFANGELAIRSRWQGSVLVAEGRSPDGAGDAGEPLLRETLSLSRDGQTLSVSITTAQNQAAQNEASQNQASMLVYTRTNREPPCEEWSTPCRDWSVLAMTGARVFDGTGEPAIESATLWIQDGRILRVGPSDRIEVPAGATTLDLSGKTITPGLINAHGHIGTTRGLESGLRHYTEDNIRAQLELYASYGVTTVASLGGGTDLGVRMRGGRSARSGPRRAEALGARFLMAGPVVDATTPAEARQQVAAITRLRADLVKIRVDDFLGRGQKMSPEVYSAVIAEAHANELRVAAHLYYLEDAKGLVRAGADFLAHSVRDQDIDDELIELLLEKDVCLSPTLTRELSAYVYESRPAFFDDPFFQRSANPLVLEALLEPERQKRVRESSATPIYKQALDTASRNLVRLVRAGVPIAFGTDSGPPGRFQGYFEHLELELMVTAGLTPEEILLSTTRDAASCLDLARVGRLEPGSTADLLVLDANPLEDIRNLRRIHSVWIGGARVWEP